MKRLRRFLKGSPLHFARFDRDEGMAYGPGNTASPASGGGCVGLLLRNPRLLIGLLVAAVAVFKYFGGTTSYTNPFTGRMQHLASEMDTPEEEIAMGLQSAPGMIREMGGEVNPRDPNAQMVQRVGQKIINSTAVKETPYKFQFHLLADREVINAFALPGGQIFITSRLLELLESEDQLAGVLGHEIGHVVGRHSTEQMAKTDLLQGLARGAGVLMSDGQSQGSAQMAASIANLIGMKYGRDDETEADSLGVKFLIEVGYNPEAMIGVMEILKNNAGGGHQPEIMSTHPDPGNRIEHIRAEIAKYRR